MTTPSSGPLGLLDIQNEFGGSNPIGIDEYYAGGPFVAAGTAGIPSSGVIGIGDFYNKSAVNYGSVSISAGSVAEGNTVVFTYTPVSGVPNGTYYYRLEILSNLQAADFSTATSGSFTLSGTGTINIQIAQDSAIEGSGTFRLVIGTESGVPIAYVTSSVVTVTDTYSAWINSISRSTIYRYANLNTSYLTSTIQVGTSGFINGSISWQLETVSAYALDSNDISTRSGTLFISSNDPASNVINATAVTWNGAAVGTLDKVFRVKLTLPDGSVVYSSNITLTGTPFVSSSVSPSGISEGQTATVTLTTENIPIGVGAASLFYTMSGTANPTTDWFLGTSSGSFSLDTNPITFYITAAIDTVSEGPETLNANVRINSTSGTLVAFAELTISSPAIIYAASATQTTVQIDNVSSYPVSRNFNVLWRVKPAASAGSASPYGAYNSPYSGGVLTAGSYSMNAPAITYTTNSGNNNGVFDYEILLTGSGFENYTITRTGVVQTFPVYALVFSVTGTNAVNAVRTVYAQITSTPLYPEQRNFVIEYKLKAAGTATWSAWAGGFSSTVNVPANSSSSANTEIRPPTAAGAQYDVQLRCVLPWQEIRESNIIYGVWL